MDKHFEITEKKCPNCGGNLVFDSNMEKAKCEYCGCNFTIDKKKARFLELNFNDSGKLNSVNVNTREAIESVTNAIEKPVQKLHGYYKQQKAEQERKIEEARFQAELQQQKNKEHWKKYWKFYAIGIIVFIVAIIVVCIAGTHSENKANEGKIAMPNSSSELYGDNYEDVEKLLKKAGFTNVEAKPLEDMIIGFLYSEGDVQEIVIDGDNSSFNSGAHYYPDAEIVIKYHSYPAENSANLQEETSEIATESAEINELKDTDNEDVILTIENNEDLKKLLTTDSPDELAIDFAKKYKNRKIEFDGYVETFGYTDDSNTLYYNFVIRAGDNGEYIGPMFFIHEFSMDEMNVSGRKSLHEGDNVHIVAKVKEYNDITYAFWIEPVSTKLR